MINDLTSLSFFIVFAYSFQFIFFSGGFSIDDIPSERDACIVLRFFPFLLHPFFSTRVCVTHSHFPFPLFSCLELCLWGMVGSRLMRLTQSQFFKIFCVFIWSLAFVHIIQLTTGGRQYQSSESSFEIQIKCKNDPDGSVKQWFEQKRLAVYCVPFNDNGAKACTTQTVSVNMFVIVVIVFGTMVLLMAFDVRYHKSATSLMILSIIMLVLSFVCVFVIGPSQYKDWRSWCTIPSASITLNDGKNVFQNFCFIAYEGSGVTQTEWNRNLFNTQYSCTTTTATTTATATDDTTITTIDILGRVYVTIPLVPSAHFDVQLSRLRDTVIQERILTFVIHCIIFCTLWAINFWCVREENNNDRRDEVSRGRLNDQPSATRSIPASVSDGSPSTSHNSLIIARTPSMTAITTSNTQNNASRTVQEIRAPGSAPGLEPLAPPPYIPPPSPHPHAIATIHPGNDARDHHLRDDDDNQMARRNHLSIEMPSVVATQTA
jgi:hypothetical protein